MSQLLISDYLKQLDLIKKVSGSQRETIVREAFNLDSAVDRLFSAGEPCERSLF